jgi:DNA polymerase III subunit beta
MKFICTQENFNKALSIVSHIASRSATLPILNNILIQADKNEIKLSATNLEIGISTTLRGKVDSGGVFTTQAKLIADFVNLLPKKNIEVDLRDQNLFIECENNKTFIKGMDANDFPIIPEIQKKEPVVVKSFDLKKAINQVLFSITLDESRPEISGALLIVNNKTLTLVGTDSYRLSEKRIALSAAVAVEHKVIVPLKTLQELSRIINETDNSDTSIYLNDTQILFLINEETELISRLIDGQYPDYQQIIPDHFKTQLKVNTSEFIRTIKSTSLFCKPGINDVRLLINSEKKELVISATNSGLGENTIILPIEVQGENNEMIFNYRYLLDGLNNLNSEETTVELIGDKSPGVLKPTAKEGYIYIVMPIRQ